METTTNPAIVYDAETVGAAAAVAERVGPSTMRGRALKPFTPALHPP